MNSRQACCGIGDRSEERLERSGRILFPVRLAADKYVFVTGGVVSSLGKGIAPASLAHVRESRGLKVSLVKLDPYINVDPGTMIRISTASVRDR